MPGGRPAGSLNKNKTALIALLEAKFPGYNPVVEMAAIANDESVDLPMRAQMHKEVAQYTHPKLKAVETTIEGRIDATIGWSDPHRVQSETPAS